MSNRPAAKTPTVAIARILRDLGLKQGNDFRVRGQYQGTGQNRERIGTYVAALTGAADQVIADHADEIERLASEAGHSFRVSIHFTANGRMWTWVANYGQRTRDTVPAATLGRDDETQAPAEQSRRTVKTIEQRPGRNGAPVIKATLGQPHPAFEQPDSKRQRAADALRSLAGQVTGAVAEATARPSTDDPYEGLAQKRFGSLYWACEQAGSVWFFQDGQHGSRYTLRIYTGRVQVRGWYLTGPGLPVEGRRMGTTLTESAEASADVILDHKWITERMAATARQWPKGLRVTNGHRTGAVNGVAWGVVTLEGHENYGRPWVDVDWDAVDGDMGTNRRGRPFTDTLTRI